MRRILLTLLLLAWVCFAHGEQRVALVIGNGAYQDGPLKNPPNDAQAMARALRECDFEVIEKINSDQRTMEDAIRDFGMQIQKGGVGLFFYAGHGMQVQGRNYLIPVGAEVNAEHEVKYEAVDAGRVLSEMASAGNRVNIVILDACRNNPFARSFRSSDRGLKKMNAPPGTLLAYATAPGDVAADGDEAYGLYTSMLLKHMKQPGVSIMDVFMRVRRDVKEASDGIQVPWEETSLTEDFVFVAPASYEETASQVENLKKQLETEKARREADSLKRELDQLQRAKTVEKATSWVQMNWWVVLLVGLVGISTFFLTRRGRQPRRRARPSKKSKAKITSSPPKEDRFPEKPKAEATTEIEPKKEIPPSEKPKTPSERKDPLPRPIKPSPSEVPTESTTGQNRDEIAREWAQEIIRTFQEQGTAPYLDGDGALTYDGIDVAKIYFFRKDNNPRRWNVAITSLEAAVRLTLEEGQILTTTAYNQIENRRGTPLRILVNLLPEERYRNYPH